MITFIDNDFVMEFNDSAKDLKAESDFIVTAAGKEEVTSIEIWTKTSEVLGAVKIITIAKEDATDANYKYRFSATTEEGETLRYNRTITTKADLRKALETTIMFIEGVDSFSKYIPDIQNTIDRL